MRKPPLTRMLAVACVLALAATAGVWWLFSGSERRITAYFDAAVGVYPGGDVRILGVAVGTVDEVRPNGKTVRVDMSLDRDVDVPAEDRKSVV